MHKKILSALAILLLVSGCGSAKPNNVVIDNNTADTKPKTSIVQNVKKVEKNYISIYTGENITKEDYKRVPFMTVIENIKAARPQSGLSQADIVFETMAEGGIPRFMALFQSKKSEVIGPIRSDRTYFNELAETFDLPFAHCGGNQVAINEIQNKRLMSLNEMANGSYYWRSKNRKAPHNLYTSSDKLIQLINKKNYSSEPKFNLQFDDTYWENNSIKAGQIILKLSNYYSTAYTYKEGKYYKTMNNINVPDKNNGEQLSCKNVIVQITRIAPIFGDAKDRVNVKLTGSGSGYVLSNGSYKKMNWQKENEYSQIKITDENGNSIKLSSGNTWWEIVDKNSKITIK